MIEEWQLILEGWLVKHKTSWLKHEPPQVKQKDTLFEQEKPRLKQEVSETNVEKWKSEQAAKRLNRMVQQWAVSAVVVFTRGL